tara:strand:- start:106 stop:522 length:417 start_codon:yes stop_codon:yes gene_type:complete
MKILLSTLLFFTAFTPVLASETESQSGYSKTRTCFKSEYREEYIPGTEDSPGFVKSWKEVLEVPCEESFTDAAPTSAYSRRITVHEEIDTNDCSSGTTAGAIVGGGLGAILSSGDGRWWAIPTGALAGAVIGCDIDGG